MNQVAMISRKTPALSLYELKNEILKHFHVYRTNARWNATHRYTPSQIAEFLQEFKCHRITATRVGLTMQAMGARPYQDGADGCKYYYISARRPEDHTDYINPKHNPHHAEHN